MEDRRSDPTLAALRQNWPIIVVASLGLMSWQALKGQVDTLSVTVQDHDQVLDRKAFARWQSQSTLVEYRLKKLEGVCK